MRISRALLVGVVAVVVALGLGGCGGNAAPQVLPHSHTGLAVGDGNRTTAAGYSLVDLKVPSRPGVPGRLSFRIEDYRHRPVTRYVTELTKDMHVYVVSTDYAVYRHVHPVLGSDGTWRGALTLPLPGTYRVVAEFTAATPSGGDPLALGAERTVGGPRVPVPVPAPATSATAHGLTVTVTEPPTVGYEHQMELGLSKDGEPAELGTYLGAYAHVSAFDTASGALVHMHPLGVPDQDHGRSVLRFHTAFQQPGSYRMFVQARVSGIVWTVPITVEVTGQTAPAP